MWDEISVGWGGKVDQCDFVLLIGLWWKCEINSHGTAVGIHGLCVGSGFVCC